jgi:hypothetical protein
MVLIGDASVREERAATNQTLFRDINERVKELNEGFSLLTPLGEWICECADDTCIDKVAMSANEYESIRKNGARFFVAPSDEHVWADVERVTVRTAKYWVVEKFGQSGAMAREANPRTPGVGARLGAERATATMATWHSSRAEVHHDNAQCATSRRIKPRDRRRGNGEKPLCPNCKHLAA